MASVRGGCGCLIAADHTVADRQTGQHASNARTLGIAGEPREAGSIADAVVADGGARDRQRAPAVDPAARSLGERTQAAGTDCTTGHGAVAIGAARFPLMTLFE